MACTRPWPRVGVWSALLLLLGVRAVAQEHNRLAGEASPYLRQHAGNPVNWYAWGDEALLKARAEQRPIFLSIGYSSCHWCHVMAAESFADAEVAAVLNEHFVCIKVDREERPDIDELYLGAVQAMGNQGGWPLSVWLTPEGKPFFGGTYFPPQDRDGRPGFRRVCEALARSWRERREELVAAAGKLDEALQQELAPVPVPGEPDEALRDRLELHLARSFDPQFGGFAAAPYFAPKFPSPVSLSALLECGTGRSVEMVHATLEALRTGGIRDQLGGGFHRYAVDRAWRVPHFEKMLYDNALLAECLVVAFAQGGDARHAALAHQTFAWMRRELQGPDGGFWSSLDAVNSLGEGRTFVWTRAEFDQLLGDDAEFAARVFGVDGQGALEGRHVLRLAAEPGDGEQARFAAVRDRLLAARALRPQPAIDDKVLAGWNALAIRALCRGFTGLGDRELLVAARRAGDFVLANLVVDGRVRRSFCRGVTGAPGVLEDQAGVALAMLLLFEADGDPRWLAAARQLLTAMTSHFGADDGTFWNTADDAPELLVRARQPGEGSTPSGTGLAAQALLRGGLVLGDEELYRRGVAVLRAWHAYLDDWPAAVPSLVRALAFHLGGPQEIVVVGAAADERTAALLAAARARSRPAVVVHLAEEHAARLAELSPLLRGKTLLEGVPTAYLCERGACREPITDAGQLRRAK